MVFFPFEEIWGGLMLIPTLIWALFDYIFSDLGFTSGIIFALVCGLLQKRNKEKNRKEYVANIEVESLRERRERNKKYDDFNIEKEIGKIIEKRKDREINKDKDIEELR